MSIDVTERLLIGTVPENIQLDEDEIEELRACGYDIHGSYFTGETWFIGIQIYESDIISPDFYEKYQKLRQDVADELKCQIELITLANGVLWS